MSSTRRGRMKPIRLFAIPVVCLAAIAGTATFAASGRQADRALEAERALAATVSETRMVETVRRLVGFGTRMYGTPSNHQAAAWLAGAFREAGLQVTVRDDTPRAWYQPVSWEIRVAGGATDRRDTALNTTWPSSGSPSARGEGPLSLEAAPGAVCLFSANPTPETAAGCVAVLVDGRASASGWPAVGRLRGTWTIPAFTLSKQESTPLRARLASGEKVRVSFAVESKSGTDPGHTVVATLPGKDHSKYVLFCAHGDSDSGGPGANDNASGVAIVLEIARTVASAVRAGRIPQPAWDLRFASWGGEISSTRQYTATMAQDPSRLQAVFNYDQSGFGSSKDALYVEPDDVPANTALITLVRAVMRDHLGARGFPEHAASVKTQGGTDSYVFQNVRAAGATAAPQPPGAQGPERQGAPPTAGAEGGTAYPSVTLYTSAWDREREVPVTTGFPPLNWYPGEKPGMLTVDGDAFYHSVGDTPANTTDTEPFNMGWCARAGLLSALRLMGGR